MLSLAGGGCGTSMSVPVTDVRQFAPITLSCKDTTATRAQIVAHNSRYDTLKSGKRVIYKDDCPVEPKAKPTS